MNESFQLLLFFLL